MATSPREPGSSSFLRPTPTPIRCAGNAEWRAIRTSSAICPTALRAEPRCAYGRAGRLHSSAGACDAATAYAPCLAQNLAPNAAGYQLVAKKYMKKGCFLVFGIGVAE